MHVLVSTRDRAIVKMLHSKGGRVVGRSGFSDSANGMRFVPVSGGKLAPGVYVPRGMSTRSGGSGVGVNDLVEVALNLATSPAGYVVTAIAGAKAVGAALEPFEKILDLIEKIKGLAGRSSLHDNTIVVKGASSLSDGDRKRIVDKAMNDGIVIRLEP